MKILLVDDDDAIREVIQAILKSAQHQVIEAENGEVAVQMFQQEQPDLIIMDLLMPVMDGHTATKIIKQQSVNKFVPIIYVTSSSGDDTLIECLNNGGDDFISKPVNMAILLAKLEALERTLNLQKLVNEKNKRLEEINQLIHKEQTESERIYSKIIHRGKLDCDCIKKYQKASYTFNGDILMTATRPNGSIHFLVGDFTGHGLPAAICATPVVDIFYQMTRKGFSLPDIIIEINEKIRSFLPADRFLSVTLFEIDVSNKKLKIWNGGMPEVLIFSNDGQLKHAVESSSLPLGIVEASNIPLDFEMIDLEEDDLILAYSDGVTEVQSAAGKLFGRNRLESVINKDKASVNVIDHIIRNIEEYNTNKKFDDDISLLSIKVNFTKLALVGKNKQEAATDGDWQANFRLEASKLKVGDSVSTILSAVSSLHIHCIGRETLQLILTEMFSNALEHGLLKLDSGLKQDIHGFEEYYKEKEKRLEALTEGYIDIGFVFKKEEPNDSLTIVMEDSGDGFDTSKLSTNSKDKNILSSRGLGLLNRWCKNIEYNKKGNRITAHLKC